MLKKALKRAETMGDAFNVGPECEFFLFQTDGKGMPATETGDEASHHEVAQGQHEIDFKSTDALTAAYNIMTFKLAVKALANKNGLHAAFMPKPVQGINGIGIAMNSITRTAARENISPPRSGSKAAFD